MSVQRSIRVPDGDSLASSDIMQADTFEIPDDTIEQSVSLFSVLSSEDAVRIFLYAEKGIASSTQAIKDLGLTQKRYYSRLKGLIDNGLIEKVEGVYVYTPIGEILHKLGLTLIELLRNKDRIEFIMSLSKSDYLSQEERIQINRLLVDHSDIGIFLRPIIGDITLSSEKIEKISNYGKLVDRINEEVSLAKKSVYIATIYFEPLVMDTILKHIKKGIMSKCLMSKKTMSKKMTKLRMLMSPKVIMNIFELMSSSSDISDYYREANFPFSFCIIDGQKCFFEFPSIDDSEFSLAFFLVDSQISKRFSKFFEDIWDTTNADQEPDLYKNI